MIFGITVSQFAQLHVLVSLGAILSGFVVLIGLICNRRFPIWTVVFLTTVAATAASGFAFPFHAITTAQVIGVLCLGAVAAAIFARYLRLFANGWRRIYVVSCVSALYLNVFLAVVQVFHDASVPAKFAPLPAEPLFLVVQFVVLSLFVILVMQASKRFQAPASGYRVI